MTRLCTVGKKIALIFTLALMMQAKAFPEFEVSFTVPLGASFINTSLEGNTFIQRKPYLINYEDLMGALTFNTGVLMQIGNNFDLKNETGLTSISLLADIGYSFEEIGVIYEKSYYFSNEDYVVYDSTSFHTLNLGIIPKLHFYLPSAKFPFSVGFGGGVKIPLSGKRYLTKESGNQVQEDLSYLDIKEIFIYPFMPYVKLTYDTYFYVSKSVALTLGAYMSYNFGMEYDTDKINTDAAPPPGTIYGQQVNLTEYGYSSFDIGITFGISFGRPDPRPKE